MAINADKPHLWKRDIALSVDLFNCWFMEFAPTAYRQARMRTTEQVKEAVRLSSDLNGVRPGLLLEHPEILPILRMATAPPIARDRLIGLAQVKQSLVHRLEKGLLPVRMSQAQLGSDLGRICAIITRLLDTDIFPWVGHGASPTEHERTRASTIVADRLCGAIADPVVRNAQEQRQLERIAEFLSDLGYTKAENVPGEALPEMPPGTFAFRHIVVVGDRRKVNIPIDVLIQPKQPRRSRIPLLIEAKSAGDFTNTNKRRKEEATKIHQIRATYGDEVQLVLFLCGYFDSGYLGYEAAEGLDWVWEHRIDDLMKLGL
jgi:hypothetical protein